MKSMKNMKVYLGEDPPLEVFMFYMFFMVEALTCD